MAMWWRSDAPGVGVVYRAGMMISLEQLEALCHRAAAGEGSLADALLPVATALDDIPGPGRQQG